MEIKAPYQPGRCPHCGAKTGSNRTDVYLYGSPIRTCEKCKEKYLNACYHEIEVDGFSQKDVSVEANKKNVRNALILLAAAVAVNALFYLLDRYTWIYLLFLAIGVFYLISTLSDAAKVKNGAHKQKLEQEQQASIQRLSDHQYARQLKALGYDVPEKYLPGDSFEITEE